MYQYSAFIRPTLLRSPPSLPILVSLYKHQIHMHTEIEWVIEWVSHYFLCHIEKWPQSSYPESLFESSRHQCFPFYLHTDNSISFEWFIQCASSAFKFIEWNKWRLKCAWKWKWKWIFSKRLEQLFRSCSIVLSFVPFFHHFISFFPFSFGNSSIYFNDDTK